MSRLLNGYLRLLRDYTLPTQMATSMAIMTVGDSIAQHGVEGRSFREHQWSRTGRFMFYASSFWAPLAYNWHRLLNRVNTGNPWTTGPLRLLIDGALFAPFAQCYFFTMTGLLEGRSLQNIKSRIEKNFWYVYTRGLMVFGPTQLINLTIVPVYARPPVMNCVAAGWTAFLAHVATRPDEPIKTDATLLAQVPAQEAL